MQRRGEGREGRACSGALPSSLCVAFGECVDVLDALRSQLLDEVVELVLEVEELFEVISQFVLSLRLVLRFVLVDLTGQL